MCSSEKFFSYCGQEKFSGPCTKIKYEIGDKMLIHVMRLIILLCIVLTPFYLSSVTNVSPIIPRVPPKENQNSKPNFDSDGWEDSKPLLNHDDRTYFDFGPDR